MRLRNVKGAKEAMIESPYVVNEPKEYKGKWKEVFKNENPIYIEVGMGKGNFITTLAKQNPDINYIGIEKYSSVLIRGLEKRAEVEKEEHITLSNLMFIRMDAEEIEEVFDKEEVSRIYLNFSDPWPKDRHAKRRLTSTTFLKRYDNILKADGVIEFKTDNISLFHFSVASVKEAGWNLVASTEDLHHSPMNEGNVMTEYERKFSSMGNPICKLVCNRSN